MTKVAKVVHLPQCDLMTHVGARVQVSDPTDQWEFSAIRIFNFSKDVNTKGQEQH